jgi:hypothetical protein
LLINAKLQEAGIDRFKEYKRLKDRGFSELCVLGGAEVADRPVHAGCARRTAGVRPDAGHLLSSSWRAVRIEGFEVRGCRLHLEHRLWKKRPSMILLCSQATTSRCQGHKAARARATPVCSRGSANARHRLPFRFAPKSAPKMHFVEIIAGQNRPPKSLEDADSAGYFIGERGGTRTLDPMIKSHMLTL